MQQRKVSFTDEEWAAIVAPIAAQVAELRQHTDSNVIRLALGLSPIYKGGIIKGGFEHGNQHNPKRKKAK